MKKLVVSLVGFALGSAFAVSEIDLPVPSGEMTIAQALTASGKTLADFKGSRLRKTGAGTLVSDNSIRADVCGVTVAEGLFKFKSNDELGQTLYGSGDGLEIVSGATARFVSESGYANINNRLVNVNGTGRTGQGGAIVAEGACEMTHAQFRIKSDATFYAEADGECYLLGSTGGKGNCDFIGHTLTLKAKEPTASFCLTSGFAFRGKGRLVVDGTTLGERSNDATYKREIGEGKATPYHTLVLRNGASFRPRGQNVVALFDAIEAAGDTAIVAGDGGSAAFGMVVGKFTGAPEISGITSLTITNVCTFSVADFMAGKKLEVTGDLVFGDKATLAVEGDLDALTETARSADGKRITILTATGTLSGFPILKQTWATRHWTLVLGADGKSLELVYDNCKPSTSYVDVAAEWGIKTGEANASANSAAFAANLAQVKGGKVLYFPKGEYWFSETLVINKAEVGLRGDFGESVLRAASGFTGSSLVSVTENYASVKQLTLQGVTGPAISVSPCTSFVAYGNTFRDVGGVIAGTSDRYPVAADTVNFLEVYANVPSSAPYAGPLHTSGTCEKTDKCEPSASQVAILVNAGETLDFYSALGRTSYGKADLKGQKVLKFGPGTLVGTNDLVSKDGAYFTGLDVQEGIFRARIDADFGYKDYGNNDPVYVRNGATVRLDASSLQKFVNRVVHLAGSGQIGEAGALVCEGHAEGNGAQYRIDEDAVIATLFTPDYSLCFQSGGASDSPRSNCDFQGHTLTLKGVDGGKGFRFVNKFQTRGQGRLVVDGTYLGQGSNPVVTEPWSAPTAVTLELKNGAMFRPRTQDVVTLFTNFDVDATSQVLGGEQSATAFDMTIGGWIGPGAVNGGISSLTITDSFVASADDILAGRCLTALCPIVFANGVKMTLENAEALSVTGGPYVCAASGQSVVGVPGRAPGCRFRGWGIGLGADSKSLELSRVGMILFIR